MRQATLSWSNGDGTASCRVLLEGIGSYEESTQDFAVNISGLKPGVQYSINPYLLQSDKTEGDPLGTEGGLGELQRVPPISLTGSHFQYLNVLKNKLLFHVYGDLEFIEGFSSAF